MSNKHLWEVDHPYYCQQSPHMDEFESWESFLQDEESYACADQDMNLLFRWDWTLSEDRDNEGDALELFFVHQRHARVASVSILVEKGDEPRIIEWLRPRAHRISAVWEPLLSEGEAA